MFLAGPILLLTPINNCLMILQVSTIYTQLIATMLQQMELKLYYRITHFYRISIQDYKINKINLLISYNIISKTIQIQYKF